ncbi:GH32 C-terminal domain-containing protein [Corynebacterium sp. ZY180755]
MTHRPELHITPESGILEAPAGALWEGNTWHVFSQYRTAPGEGARWAHQTSEDTPFSFDICDDALAPEEDEISLRAGAVTSVDDEVALYFTAVTDSGGCIKRADVLDLEASGSEVSDNPLALDPQVQRRGTVVDDSHGGGRYTKFRSPCVVPDWKTETNRSDGHSGWIMLAVANADDTPHLVILESEDGQEWEMAGELSFVGDTGLNGSMLAAPRIIRLRDEVDGEIYDILIVTIEHNDIDVSGYLVGRLVGTEFTVTSPFCRLDYGHDFTRPRNTNLPSTGAHDTQRYNFASLFGLMNGIGRKDRFERHSLSWDEEGWANCLTLPRRLTLEGGRIFQRPITGLLDAVLLSDAASMWIGVAEIPSGEDVTITLRDSSNNVAAVITHRGDSIELDRSMNSRHEGDAVAVAPLAESDTDSLTIVVDGSTVEIYADGGQIAMASRVYFDGTCERYDVSYSDGAELLRADEIRPR